MALQIVLESEFCVEIYHKIKKIRERKQERKREHGWFNLRGLGLGLTLGKA
jgi:hypothetical protein